MTTNSSIVGFKDPRFDLHRKSPRYFWLSSLISVLFIVVLLNTPLLKKENIEKVEKKPPVIIKLENIPETHHQVTAPAPKLGMPLEVSDDVMLDDVTIEDTNLDMSITDAPPVKPVIVEEEPVEEVKVEEEIFEFFAVEEQPVRTQEVMPKYPETAQKAGVQGTVFVRALVGINGSVERAEVLKGPELLHQAALDAAFATKFTPAKQNDMPVKCWVQMRFAFELE